MKHSFKVLTLMAVSILTLSSCEKDAMDSGISTMPTTTSSSNSTVPVSQVPINLMPRLVKMGVDTIVYDHNHKIGMVTNTVTGTYSKYGNIYTVGHIVIGRTSYMFNGQYVNLDVDYLFNDNGTAKYFETEFIGPSGAIITTTRDSLKYNDQKQLVKRSFATGWYEFTYNGSGDMINKKWFKKNGQLFSETNITYSVRGNDGFVDKNKLNPDYLDVNPYMDFFGKTSVHLPLRMVTTGNGGDVTDISYAYTFNPDGTMKTRTKTNSSGSTVIETLDFKYK